MAFAFLWMAWAGLLDVPPVTTECICMTAKTHDGWCDPCKVGYVAGLRIPSKLLFSTIDHGHVVSPENLRCASCKRALSAESFCERCRIGYYKGKLYLSSFTYWLARGKRVDPHSLTCSVCIRNSSEGGWCDGCERGLLGNVEVVDRAGFDETVAAYRRLKLGLKHLDQCELCAIAIYSNGMCPKCRRVYVDGKGQPE